LGADLPERAYCQLFDRSFPALAKNPWRFAEASCGTYFRSISKEELHAVRQFIESLRPCVVIKDFTSASLALGYRARKSASGDLEATELGQLMRDAKPYNEAPTEDHRRYGTELARRMWTFVNAMPFYRDVDGFVAVPPSDPAKAFSIPRGFAYCLAKHTGKADLSGAETKTAVRRELKNLPLEQKVEALVGSVVVDTTKVADKTIVVVDDLYQSGLTINYLAEELREAGAKEVFGLAAVKTLRNDDNLPKIAAAKHADDDSDDEFPF
jgi:phosphoribosylpyrophosphate synthetase